MNLPNLLLAVRHGGRKLKAHPFLFVLLAFSLSVSISLSAIVGNLFYILNQDRPNWVGSTDKMITVAGQTNEGQLVPLSPLELEQLSALNGVINYTYISVTQTHIKFAGHPKTLVTVAYYPANFVSFLNAAEPFTRDSYNHNDIFINPGSLSNRMADATSLQGKSIQKGRHQFIANRVLPANFRGFGGIEVDLWLPESVAYLVNDDNEEPVNFVKTLSASYGFAAIHDDVALDILQHRFDQAIKQMSWPTSGYYRLNREPIILQGVELDPLNRANVRLQAWVLLGLLAVFVLVTFCLVITTAIQQTADRQAEFRTLLTVGAIKWQIAKNVMWEHAILLGVVLLLSVLGTLGGQSVIASGKLYLDYFGRDPEINWLIFGGSLITFVSVFLLSYCLPIFRLSQRKLFAREFRVGASALSKFIQPATFVTQITLVLCVITFTTYLALHELNKQKIRHVSPTVMSLSGKIGGADASIAASPQLLQGQVYTRQSMDVAVSYPEFTRLNTIEMSYREVGEASSVKHSVASMYVSDNFFELVGIPALAGKSLSKGKIAINKVLATRLLKKHGLGSKELNKLIGLPLVIDRFPVAKTAEITLIVEDAPHLGTIKSVPLVYFSTEDFSRLIATKVPPTFYVDSAFAQEFFENMQTRWLEFNTSRIEYVSPVNVVAQVKALNPTGEALLVSALSLSGLILFISYAILFAQTKLQIKENAFKMAVYLATGASQSGVIKQFIAEKLGLGLVSLMLFGTLSILLFCSLPAPYHLAFSRITSMTVISVTVFSLVLLTAYIGISRQMQCSIRQQLNH